MESVELKEQAFSFEKDQQWRIADLYDLGFVSDYNLVWKFQKELLEKKISNSIPNSVILVEHDHVLTLGRGGHLDNILVRGLPIFEIERGGDVTYHGPGQLVVYPIISLSELGMGVRQYVEALETAVVDTLANLGLKDCAGKLGGLTGVWVSDSRKIASIGVATSHWVTYHGLALNVSTDLSYFRKIKPCGFESSIMTSIEREFHSTVEFSRVKQLIVSSISEIFKLQFNARTAHF